MTGRLHRLEPLGIRWTWFLAETTGYLRPDEDPWIVHELQLLSGLLPDNLPAGPAIYAAIGNGEWQYAGKTVRPVEDRLRGHRTDNDRVRRNLKAANWHGLVVAPLLTGTPPREVSRMERAAKDLLRPRMGQRWSRSG